MDFEENSGWSLDFDGWPRKAVGDDLAVHVKGVGGDAVGRDQKFKISIQAGEFLEGIAGPVEFACGRDQAMACGEALAERLAKALADPEAVKAINGPLSKFALLFEIKDHPERFQEQKRHPKGPPRALIQG